MDPDLYGGKNITVPAIETEPLENYRIIEGGHVTGVQHYGTGSKRINLAENSSLLRSMADTVVELVSTDIGSRNQDWEDEAKKFMDLGSFLALNVLRYNKKDDQATGVHITEQAHKTLESLSQWDKGELPAPALDFIKHFKSRFSTESESYKELLACPVYLLIKTQNEELKGFLKAGCLLALSENGLGALNWIHKAWAAHGLTDIGERHNFMQLIMNGLTGPSAASVWEFLNTKQAPGWPFARLFKQAALLFFLG